VKYAAGLAIVAKRLGGDQAFKVSTNLFDRDLAAFQIE
jgi:hypothetical protein